MRLPSQVICQDGMFQKLPRCLARLMVSLNNDIINLVAEGVYFVFIYMTCIYFGGKFINKLSLVSINLTTTPHPPTTTKSPGAVKFNSDISNWDVSSVEDMQWMFYETHSFTGDLSKWNVSKVSNFRTTFYQLWDFNSDLSAWDTSSATTMRYMFYDMPKFNSDISGWDVSKVTLFEEMFWGATAFNQDLSQWNISSGEYQ